MKRMMSVQRLSSKRCMESECCKLMEHSFGLPDDVRSFQDSRACVSVALLLKVVILPGAGFKCVGSVYRRVWRSLDEEFFANLRGCRPRGTQSSLRLVNWSISSCLAYLRVFEGGTEASDGGGWA